MLGAARETVTEGALSFSCALFPVTVIVVVGPVTSLWLVNVRVLVAEFVPLSGLTVAGLKEA
jgi:hypothetical protein